MIYVCYFKLPVHYLIESNYCFAPQDAVLNLTLKSREENAIYKKKEFYVSKYLKINLGYI